MAFAVGVDGLVTIGANALPLDGFTITRSRGAADTTVFGSSFTARMATLKDWGASIQGTFHTTDARQAAVRDQLEDGAAADIALEFRMSSSTVGAKYSGNGVIVSDNIGSSVDGKVSWSAEVQGNGALAWTAAT